jgi:hypothetical protein
LREIQKDLAKHTDTRFAELAEAHRAIERSLKAFLHNHVTQLVSIDFFMAHTIWFEILFVFVLSRADDNTNWTKPPAGGRGTEASESPRIARLKLLPCLVSM